MKLSTRIGILAMALVSIGFLFGCQPTATDNAKNTATNPATFNKVKLPLDPSGAQTATEAYTRLFTAVKAKDINAIKQMMSKASLGMAESAGQRQNKPIEDVIKNGFTATTFSDSMPEARDLRELVNYASLEVRNEKENRWEDLPFVIEDGSWKLAVGDLFSGIFPSAEIGPSKAIKDQIASNKSMPNAGMVPTGNSNANNAKINVVKPQFPEGMKQPSPTGK
jgi:hypothetical protein